MAKLRDRIYASNPTERSISDFDFQRFVKLCELLASPEAGERATAAFKASLILKAAGLRWSDIVKDRCALMEHVARGKPEDVGTRARRFWKPS
jgi:hypothetical protein